MEGGGKEELSVQALWVTRVRAHPLIFLIQFFSHTNRLLPTSGNDAQLMGIKQRLEPESLESKH